MQTQTQFSALAKWLHWLVAGLILTQYILSELAERAEHAGLIVKQLGIVANHKSIGMTILALAILRLGYRVFNPPPPLPDEMPKWQTWGSHASHILLYAFLFALPITGWLMSSAYAYTVSWFNLFALPDLIAANKATANWLGTLHFRLADALALLAFLHIAAAIKHHVVDKDDVLRRMLSMSSVTAGLLVAIVGVVWFGGLPQDQNNQNTQQAQQTNNEEQTQSLATLSASNLPTWKIDYAKSYIKFSGEQAGAPFSGEWTKWQAKLQFDGTQLADSRFDVNIDINAVESNDDERDDTIRSSDFFDVMSFPKANYQAQEFEQTDTGYTANGQLTMKGISLPTPLSFSIQQSGNTIELTGQAKLTRHDWNIGTGDWADPTWVGSDVIVDVFVSALMN